MQVPPLPTPQWRLGYRPALDGLRAVGVLLVIAAHSWSVLPPELGGGGAAGVSVFFVLSGFLITAVLLEERSRTGRIDLRRFYARRARRLLPPLIPVLVVASVMAHEQLGRIALAALYLGNWIQLLGGELGVVQPLWTLAIEEQFYLLWPAVLLFFAGSLHPKSFLAVAAGIALVMTMPSSAGALVAGCAIAALAHTGRLPRVRAWLGSAGLVLIAAAIVGPGLDPAEEMALNHGAVAATAGSVLVVGRIATDTTALPILQWTPLRWTGLISYGLYLWHWPLIWLTDPSLTLVFALPLAVLAATTSYILIERSVRSPTNLRLARSRPQDGRARSSVASSLSVRLRTLPAVTARK